MGYLEVWCFCLFVLFFVLAFGKFSTLKKKNQIQILKLNNSTDTMKNAWDSIWNTEMEERINELEKRNLPMLQVEEERELRFLKQLRNTMCSTRFIKKAKIQIMGILE